MCTKYAKIIAICNIKALAYMIIYYYYIRIHFDDRNMAEILWRYLKALKRVPNMILLNKNMNLIILLNKEKKSLDLTE